MGEPLRPVVIDLKMSSRDDPPRNVQLCVRSAGRIAWPQSSTSVGADGPSPRPSAPWHFTQPLSSKSFLPAAIDSLLAFGADGSVTGFGSSSGFEKSGENVVRKYARSETC